MVAMSKEAASFEPFGQQKLAMVIPTVCSVHCPVGVKQEATGRKKAWAQVPATPVLSQKPRSGGGVRSGGGARRSGGAARSAGCTRSGGAKLGARSSETQVGQTPD